MTLEDFRDAALALRFIDRDQVLWMKPTQWQVFRNDPVTYLLHATEHDAERIWDTVQQRRYAKMEGRK